MREEFSDSILVLLGHGTTLNDDSAAPVFQHAAELRRRHLFAEVREAFWKQRPNVREVLPSLNAARVFLVPMFISEGYFCGEVIPRALGFDPAEQGDHARVQRRGGQTLFYCKPVGTHGSMTDVLLARAREVLEKFPFPRLPPPKNISLFLAGHGTQRSADSRKAVERQVELIRALGLYAWVQAVFLEEEPRIGDCHQLAPTRDLVVVPFFISDGLHAQEDIPVLLGEPERIVRQRLQAGQPPWRNPTEHHGKRVWYAASVGTDPRLAGVILERVREAALWT